MKPWWLDEETYRTLPDVPRRLYLTLVLAWRYASEASQLPNHLGDQIDALVLEAGDIPDCLSPLLTRIQRLPRTTSAGESDPSVHLPASVPSPGARIVPTNEMSEFATTWVFLSAVSYILTSVGGHVPEEIDEAIAQGTDAYFNEMESMLGGGR